MLFGNILRFTCIWSSKAARAKLFTNVFHFDHNIFFLSFFLAFQLHQTQFYRLVLVHVHPRLNAPALAPALLPQSQISQPPCYQSSTTTVIHARYWRSWQGACYFCCRWGLPWVTSDVKAANLVSRRNCGVLRRDRADMVPMKVHHLPLNYV